MSLVDMNRKIYRKPLAKFIVIDCGRLLVASGEAIKVIMPDATEELDYEVLSKDGVGSEKWDDE